MVAQSLSASADGSFPSRRRFDLSTHAQAFLLRHHMALTNRVSARKRASSSPGTLLDRACRCGGRAWVFELHPQAVTTVAGTQGVRLIL
jgi:hypothetical protein